MSTSPRTPAELAADCKHLARDLKGFKLDSDVPLRDALYELIDKLAALASAAQGAPVAWVNGDELDNMLDDRTATIEGRKSGLRGVPLYRVRAAPVNPTIGREELVDAALKELRDACKTNPAVQDPGYVGVGIFQWVNSTCIAPAPVPAPVVPTEVRKDGKTVRKDRWEIGIRRIVALLWGNRHEFEVDDVVDAVAKLVKEPFNDGDDEGLLRAVMKGKS